MRKTLGVMITCTTYGMWLRGDRRGWVEDGKILPADPAREDADRAAMNHTPWTFTPPQVVAAGALICESLRARMDSPVWALAIESWHLHAVVDAGHHDIGRVVKCVKDAVRYGLRPGRPIWANGYDKRWCFDEASLRRRIQYVERHNVRHGFPGRRWDGVIPCPHLAPGQ
ncbi:MAG: hypothetical protein AAF333_09305 [Planctomycetota bacterium]